MPQRPYYKATTTAELNGALYFRLKTSWIAVRESRFEDVTVDRDIKHYCRHTFYLNFIVRFHLCCTLKNIHGYVGDNDVVIEDLYPYNPQPGKSACKRDIIKKATSAQKVRLSRVINSEPTIVKVKSDFSSIPHVFLVESSNKRCKRDGLQKSFLSQQVGTSDFLISSVIRGGAKNYFCKN